MNQQVRPPFEAYIGDEPYIFISYAHKDCAIVFEQIQMLHEAGYHVWYDEGIDPGNEWADEIAFALRDCSLFMVFLSPQSAASKNVRDEMNYALEHNKNFLAIYLEDTELSEGMKLRTSGIQAIMKFNMDEESYVRKLDRSLFQYFNEDVTKNVELLEHVSSATSARGSHLKVILVCLAILIVICSMLVFVIASILQEDGDASPYNELPVTNKQSSPETGNQKHYPKAPEPAAPVHKSTPTSTRSSGPRPTTSSSTQSASKPVPGKAFRVPTLGMAFVPIQPGSFTMGSPSSESGRGSDETPHKVTISRPFWIGKHEVNQKEFKMVTGATPTRFQDKEGLRPAVAISRKTARLFCKRLTLIEKTKGRLPTGYVYRLPTEAEWEYCCRAGTTGPYSCNSQDINDYAWHKDNAKNMTQRVGQKRPNPWGIHDMHGNAWEWCEDWWAPYPTSDVTDPSGPKTGTYPIYRGGGYGDSATGCRSANRSSNTSKTYAGAGIGFRVVLAPELGGST